MVALVGWSVDWLRWFVDWVGLGWVGFGFGGKSSRRGRGRIEAQVWQGQVRVGRK